MAIFPLVLKKLYKKFVRLYFHQFASFFWILKLYLPHVNLKIRKKSIYKMWRSLETIAFKRDQFRFVTKLRSFTYFNTLFQAVVKNFVHLAWIKNT